QLVRNADSGRFMKLLGLSLAIVFIFDIYLYAQGIINRRVDLVLWQARAALLMASAFLVVGAGLLFKNQKDTGAGLGLSRPVAFYYTSLLLTSVCAITLAIGGYYVRNLGGHWGIFIFTLMLFFSLVALSALFLSNRIRQAIQVWVSKHFFHHKYDYRREWLNVIQALSDLPEQATLYETVYRSIAQTFQASCGEVRVLRGGHYQQVFNNAHWQPGPAPDVFKNDPFIRVMEDHEWVFLPQAQEGELANNNHALPSWATSSPNLQLIVPLIAQHSLVGFVALGKEGLDVDLTWEDLDILKTMGRQLANHILIHSQREQLSEARQLETYNKLSAFVMHDLNNVAAQLSLAVKNAERHKRNPAFIDDMLLTVGNAASRMNSLIQKLNRPDHQNTSQFSLHKAIAASVQTCSTTRPQPTLCVKAPDQNIQADWDRFILAFKHLIKNAQEATTENGQVKVSISNSTASTTTVSIIDDGAGMSQAFIDNQLFKPFETTKTGQGMGIGVYLTRSYLEELGANLHVRSQPGEGTEITVTFGATME
ncbi:MAG: XrtA/PEP-CTERM system histidine kinase PrsK, partial [Natronospirillum sp.]